NRLSRRKFVGTAAATAAVAASPLDFLFGTAPERAAADSTDPWRDEGILFVNKSPYAKLRNIPVHAVTITEGFWGTRRDTNLEKSIPSMEKLLEANGRMDNYLRLVGKSDAPQKGPVYSDSDVYKWTEAVGFVLQSEKQPQLQEQTEKIIR